MQVGRYHVREILAGRVRLDGGAMFGIVPRPLWERRIAPDERGRIPLAMRCLLIEGEGRRILVDCGVGDKTDAKFNDIYGLDHESSNLHTSLSAAGVQPGDITDLILTHLHFDHCGGAVSRDDDGSLVPTFPNAQVHVQRAHWEWAKESPREQASFLPENIDPLESSGLLHLVYGPGELFAGIELIVVNGHTRGQQLVRVHDRESSLLFAADLFPTSAHVPLLWVMAYDVAPLETIAEKESIARRAADEGWNVVFEHDVDVACGRIERGERGYSVVDKQARLD